AEIDLETGEVAFGTRFRFSLQWLGVEDKEANTWTWGWAQRPALPDGLTGKARGLRDYGHRENLDIFTRPRIALGSMTGDSLAIVSCGLTGSASFFIVEDGAKATYFLVPDLHGQIPPGASSSFIAEVITEMLDTYELPQPAPALRAFLQYQGFTTDEKRMRRWI